MWYPRPKYTGTNFNADIFIIVAQLIFVNPLQLYHQYSMVFLIGYFHYIIFRDEGFNPFLQLFTVDQICEQELLLQESKGVGLCNHRVILEQLIPTCPSSATSQWRLFWVELTKTISPDKSIKKSREKGWINVKNETFYLDQTDFLGQMCRDSSYWRAIKTSWFLNYAALA